MINHKGELGEFEHDETQFNLVKTDDHLPQGITDVRHKFVGSNIESSPVLHDGVTSAEGAFMGFENLKHISSISPNVKKTVAKQSETTTTVSRGEEFDIKDENDKSFVEHSI